MGSGKGIRRSGNKEKSIWRQGGNLDNKELGSEQTMGPWWVRHGHAWPRRAWCHQYSSPRVSSSMVPQFKSYSHFSFKKWEGKGVQFCRPFFYELAATLFFLSCRFFDARNGVQETSKQSRISWIETTIFLLSMIQIKKVKLLSISTWKDLFNESIFK